MVQKNKINILKTSLFLLLSRLAVTLANNSRFFFISPTMIHETYSAAGWKCLRCHGNEELTDTNSLMRSGYYLYWATSSRVVWPPAKSTPYWTQSALSTEYIVYSTWVLKICIATSFEGVPVFKRHGKSQQWCSNWRVCTSDYRIILYLCVRQPDPRWLHVKVRRLVNFYWPLLYIRLS